MSHSHESYEPTFGGMPLSWIGKSEDYIRAEAYKKDLQVLAKKLHGLTDKALVKRLKIECPDSYLVVAMPLKDAWEIMDKLSVWAEGVPQ